MKLKMGDVVRLRTVRALNLTDGKGNDRPFPVGWENIPAGSILLILAKDVYPGFYRVYSSELGYGRLAISFGRFGATAL